MTIHLVAAVSYAITSPEPAGDFDRYYAIASAGGRPYIDYQVEHPIATLAVLKAFALGRSRAAFGVEIVALNAMCDVLILWSLATGWGLAAALAYAVAVLPVIDLLFTRIDAWSTAAATAGALLWIRRRPAAAGAALAVGTAFKLWPLLLTPILAVPWRGRQSARAIGSFFLASAALAAPVWWIAGAASVREVLTFRSATGWQIESTIGSLQNLFGVEAPRLENNAYRIGALNGSLSIFLFAIGVPVCFWMMARAARASRIGDGWLASVSALLLCSAVFSAQYVIWLTPGAAIALSDGSLLAAPLVVFSTTLTGAFMKAYGTVVDHGNVGWLDYRTAARALVVIRNGLLLGLA
ncbi:MAG TPA: glycosyltransferase 87 family protein, partial [Gemmatimonadaceae bacterium]